VTIVENGTEAPEEMLLVQRKGQLTSTMPSARVYYACFHIHDLFLLLGSHVSLLGLQRTDDEDKIDFGGGNVHVTRTFGTLCAHHHFINILTLATSQM
jgi:hypothetical protein